MKPQPKHLYTSKKSVEIAHFIFNKYLAFPLSFELVFFLLDLENVTIFIVSTTKNVYFLKI
jgi:hypothetical protein